MTSQNHSTTLTVRSFRLEGEKDPQEEVLKWICDKKNKVERARYGNNSQAVREALEELAERKELVEAYRNNLDKVLRKTRDEERRKQIEEAYSLLLETIQKKQNCLETMREITALEEHCGNLHRIMDTSAVKLVNPEEREEKPGSNNLGFIAPSSQDCIFAVQDNWEWVVKLVKCIDIHLKNGSTYHQFFHEVDESQQWMEEDLKRLQNSFDLNKVDGNYKDAERLLQELKELAVAFRQWEVKANRIWDTGVKVVPVHLRVNGTEEPQPARILADYENTEVRVREGEDVLLLDNSDATMWKIRNARGQEVTVPALIVLIPGPYKGAVDAATEMKLKLLATWTDTMKRLGKKLIVFMLKVFKPDYSVEQINIIKSIPPLDKTDLLRILDHIEDSLKVHWSDHEGFIALQERILMLRMMLEEAGDDVLQDEEKYKALVVQITMLEKLMDNYKDLWKDWEKYKVALEASRSPELMLIVDKWEQLKFVSKDNFANRDRHRRSEMSPRPSPDTKKRFWPSQLPLDEMEKTLSGLKEMSARGAALHGAFTEEEGGMEEVGFSEEGILMTGAATVGHVPGLEMGRAQTGMIETGRGDVVLGRDGVQHVKEEVVTTTTTTSLQEVPGLEVGRVKDAVQEGSVTVVKVGEDVRDGPQVRRSEVREVREVREARPEVRRAVNRAVTFQGDGETLEEVMTSDGGWEETRVVTETVTNSEFARARGTSGQGSSGSGTASVSRPIMSAATSIGGGEDDLFEEGVLEEVTSGLEHRTTTASTSSIEGTDFGMATETKTAETEMLSKAENEERKTFIIRSVVNPVDQKEVSLQEAIMSGIINPNKGTYVNMLTGETQPIPVAMGAGLIRVEFTSVRRTPEKKSSIGLITVKTIRESVRPYIIKSVRDTANRRSISQQEAARADILDERRGSFLDTATGKRMLVSEAIEKQLMDVQYEGDAPLPEVHSQSYAVRGVVDRRLKKVITFYDAVRRGIIDKESGAYKDTLTLESMYVGDAIMRGFLKARPIDNLRVLDIDPVNQMLIDKTEKIHKKVLQPLKVISAFKKAASLTNKFKK